VFDTPERAAGLHRAGVRRLLAIAFKERIRDLERAWARDIALAIDNPINTTSFFQKGERRSNPRRS
jgi:hypothetical protein